MTVKSLWDRIQVFINFNKCYLSEIFKAPCFFKRTLPQQVFESCWSQMGCTPLSTTSKIIVFECNCQCKNWIGKFLLNHPFQIINAPKKIIKKHEQVTYTRKTFSQLTGYVYSCLSHSWLEVWWTLVPRPGSIDPRIPRSPQPLLHLGTIYPYDKKSIYCIFIYNFLKIIK